jgi:hypothetical protein
MVANRILHIIITIFACPVVLLELVTTFLLGILVSLSFGLLLLPISLVWVVLLAPLLGLSWLCHKLPVLRNVIGILGIPWAVFADTFVSLMPSMGELENRAVKMLLCQTWPFTWEFWQFSGGRFDIWSQDARDLNVIIARVTRMDALMQRVVQRIINGEQLDPGV